MFAKYRKMFRPHFIVLAMASVILSLVLQNWLYLFLTPALSVVEISLSFDNAVVNALILKKLNAKWQRRFIKWGIWIGVLVVRFLLPVLLVELTAHLGFFEVIQQAVTKPNQYANELDAAQPILDMFAGVYLLQIALGFFLDESDTNWINFIEASGTWIGKLKTLKVIIPLAATLLIAHASGSKQNTLLVAGALGIIVFLAVSGLAEMFEEVKTWQRFGPFFLFLYLEVQDASFSFDGVSGAFALTTNIFAITVALGIGAWIIRTLTVDFVQTKQLDKLPYLEHGAYYAIISLSGLMLLQEFVHINQTLRFALGLVSVAFIVAAVVHSLIVGTEKELDEDDNNETNELTEGEPAPAQAV
ncbi:MAG: DUF475 domain-containing protein [Candidatus Saccharibacteria bacterium]